MARRGGSVAPGVSDCRVKRGARCPAALSNFTHERAVVALSLNLEMLTHDAFV